MEDSGITSEYPPPRPRRRWVGLVALVSVLLAGAGGFIAWQLLNDLTHAQQKLAKLSNKNEDLQNALELNRSSAASLNSELTTCKQELTVEQDTRSESNQRVAELEAKVTACESSVTDLRKQRAEAKARLAEFNRLTGMFRRMIDTGRLDVVYRRGEMVVKLPAKVLFPSGSDELSEEGRKAISEVAAILRKMPKRRFTVAGHTDSVPVHNDKFESNWALSAARAVEVTEMLIRRGMRPSNLVAAGYGAFEPVASNKSRAGRQRNRRIEIILEPYVSSVLAKKVARSAKRR